MAGDEIRQCTSRDLKAIVRGRALGVIEGVMECFKQEVM